MKRKSLPNGLPTRAKCPFRARLSLQSFFFFSSRCKINLCPLPLLPQSGSSCFNYLFLTPSADERFIFGGLLEKSQDKKGKREFLLGPRRKLKPQKSFSLNVHFNDRLRS